MNAFGLYTDTGGIKEIEMADEKEEDMLMQYRFLQYNNIFDAKHKKMFSDRRQIEEFQNIFS